MTGKTKNGSARVVIVGGGVAGIETLLALADLGGDRVSQTLVSPRPDFLYKPLLVEEPFDIGPAERYELQPLAEEKGASFTQRAVSGVRKADHQVGLDDGSTLEYDFLVVCAGDASSRRSTAPSPFHIRARPSASIPCSTGRSSRTIGSSSSSRGA
jgi:NADH dehydrogenase FAD-containing subunit